MVPQDSGTIAIRNILTRLCKRSGLSSDRLRTTEIDVKPLLELPAVRRYAESEGIDPAEAVLPVVRELARKLGPTNRVIADAELTLGLLRETDCTGIDFDRLYAADLGERRAYLTDNWRGLHEAVAAEHIPPAPTVRSLRATPERRAFTALAGLLALDSGYPAVGAEAATAPLNSGAAGVVTVVGEAVIYHIYRVDDIPRAGAAIAGRFDDHPGGKGLNRAIAAARLGLRVRLACAIGDDAGGRRILDLLRGEHVDHSLIRTVTDAPTPVSAMMVTRTGTAALITATDQRIRIDPRDLALHDALATSDVVILTFGGQPIEMVEQVLELIRQLPNPPLLVVHPAPRVEQPQYLIPYFGVIDYLIGTRAELADLLPATFSGYDTADTQRDFDTDTAPRLRALGVATVCAIEGFACTVRSDDVNLDIARSPVALLEESPGAQAAFAAALAYRLITTGRTAERRDFEWATAAMAATQSFGDISGAMPTLHDIDRIANLESRKVTRPHAG
ncbi:MULTISPECIES: PfkB family carbohydrate kinase [unclassified Nocardia]|uniref:PfkB family carbohydrate kinase n=1 Tax=unclassified Nocardia TaxID=2637762 RepID=UPI0021059BF0|nr:MULTISPECIES: PfkB family carbohydrate kinase [unclassified Nocardia]